VNDCKFCRLNKQTRTNF